MINQWDIWFAEFPFDDSSGSKGRPVIVLSVEPLEVLSVKVTSHEVRNKDSYDISIVNWKNTYNLLRTIIKTPEDIQGSF